MTFTIEFQPRGLRIDCDQPINGLDAARQAGINLSAVCGGEGICGKCVIQLLTGAEDIQPTEIPITGKIRAGLSARLPDHSQQRCQNLYSRRIDH